MADTIDCYKPIVLSGGWKAYSKGDIEQIVEQAKREERERIAMMLAVEGTEFCPPESNCVVCDSDCVECIKQWLEPEPAEESK